ncbi:hypothetical protein PWT90_10518 [Aphanocladium album]|nr:hypothetical protein PWT90_10518 [Aphanocladium album]
MAMVLLPRQHPRQPQPTAGRLKGKARKLAKTASNNEAPPPPSASAAGPKPKRIVSVKEFVTLAAFVAGLPDVAVPSYVANALSRVISMPKTFAERLAANGVEVKLEADDGHCFGYGSASSNGGVAEGKQHYFFGPNHHAAMLDLPSAYSDLEKYTDDLCAFIDTPLVRQITGGIHVNDALIHNAWDSLPAEWTEWWSRWPDHRLAQQDLIDSIDEDDFEIAVSPADELLQARPASLGKWLSQLKTLALARTQRTGPTVVFPEALETRMKTKKIAEVARATRLIHDMCAVRGIRRVVDMGSGQGYLSISLACLFPELQVLAIDGSESQVAGSQAFADALGIPQRRLRHMVHWIDGSSTLVDKVQDWAAGEECILVGLHACGNLSEHMIRYFATMPCMDALAVVGCCYNHIVPLSDTCPDGFPISAALRDRNVTLSPTALMTGCQAPNNWPRPDANEPSVFGRRRLYRALLEKVFHDHKIQVTSSSEDRPAWGIRKRDMANFTAFAHRAMDCLHVDAAKRPADAELQAYEKKYKDWEGRIAILWTLSVLCCKVVESVIAVDRYRYLAERQGVQDVEVVPVFDSRVSPRNLMIVATKKPQGRKCNG